MYCFYMRCLLQFLCSTDYCFWFRSIAVSGRQMAVGLLHGTAYFACMVKSITTGSLFYSLRNATSGTMRSSHSPHQLHEVFFCFAVQDLAFVVLDSLEVKLSVFKFAASFLAMCRKICSVAFGCPECCDAVAVRICLG